MGAYLQSCVAREARVAQVKVGNDSGCLGICLLAIYPSCRPERKAARDQPKIASTLFRTTPKQFAT
eukprot:598789-Lingulodinium_polyedra.AAC.1